MISQKDIAPARLAAQQLTATKFEKASDVVKWMGAMQAQDFSMSKFAVGVRLEKTTESSVQDALNKGEILRTHVMRPTWHLVSAEDIHWMLELTAPHILSHSKSRHAELGLDEAVIKKSNRIIDKCVHQKKYVTRDEIVSKLNKASIATNENRASHLLFLAKLQGLICSGMMEGKDYLYTSLDGVVTKKNKPGRDESIFMLAQRYFNSHAPATADDFAWWSGLPAKDVKKALEMIAPHFSKIKLKDREYILSPDYETVPSDHEVLMLPAYDEFIISYKDRSMLFSRGDQAKYVSSNGIFWPTIIVNGNVAGTWSRTVKNKVTINIKPFKKLTFTLKKSIEVAAKRYAEFVEKPEEVVFTNG